MHTIRAQLVGCAFAVALIAPCANASAAEPSQTLRAKRTTSADTPVELRTHAHWDDQCHSLTLPVVIWVDNPAHGHVEQREDAVSGHTAAVGNTSCEGVTIRGLRLTYTPEAGWHGVEHLVYDVRYSYRDPIVRYEFTVTVN